MNEKVYSSPKDSTVGVDQAHVNHRKACDISKDHPESWVEGWLVGGRQDSLKGFEVLQVKTIAIWAYMVMMDMEGGEQVQDTSWK